MDRKVKYVQFGCGRMGSIVMKQLVDKAELVAAFDMAPALIGKDVGEHIGTGHMGLAISDGNEAEKILAEVKPDAMVVTTRSLMNDLKDILMIAAKLGINTITSCEEALYPIVSNPNVTKAIDEAAKKSGCTIAGSGAQELQWGTLISTLASGCNKITKISGASSYNIDDYGMALAVAHGCDFTTEEFEEKIASTDNISDEERQKLIDSGEFLPCFAWNGNAWLADKLGLHIKSISQRNVPKYAEEDLYSTTMERTVKAGKVIGMGAVSTVETEEGITIEDECIGIVYGKDDCDFNRWTIYGDPDVTLEIKNPPTVGLTCSTLVNRIPSVINAKPGFVPTSQMPVAEFVVDSLADHVK